MGEELSGMLLSLLIILMVFGSTEASCSLSGSSANCYNQGLTSVPQDLPTGTTRLDLENNLITTLDQSDFSRYGSLTTLSLQNNCITTISTHAFYNLPDLINLYLFENRLSNITSGMFTGLRNLQYLYLDNNEISDIQAGTFSSTPQLRTLYLRNNKLKKTKSDMFTGPENPWTLYLDNNDISDIQAGTFSSTPQLRTLYLRNNKLRNPKFDMFTGPENLESLHLDNNDISDIPTGTFNSTPQLRNLYLRYNKLKKTKSDMFTGPENLWTLNLNNNEISDIQAGTFNSTPQLRNLDLGNNKLTNLRSDMFTGLGNLWELWLGRYDSFTFPGHQRDTNEINDIQAGTFNSTPQLRTLSLSNNKLTNLRSDMFTGLGNLHKLWLINNEISDIQAGTFSSAPQLRNLDLQYNKLTVLKAEIFAKLSSLQYVYIYSNPWQCDCRMVPFRQKMTGSHSFENQIRCQGPSNFLGQQLKDISPEDLICEEPTIVKFEGAYNNTVVEGEMLHLVCEASGIPTPSITVIVPFGQMATVESSGRVTVEVNGAITITNVTTADAGLYACVAENPAGSTSAILVVNIQWKVTTVTVAPVMSPLPITGFLNKPESSPSYHESTPTLSIPCLTASALSKQPQPAPSFSLAVLIGSVCASIAGTVLVVIIILTIWHKRKTQNPPSPSTPPVVYSNASVNVTIDGHDQTGQDGAQTISKILKNARSSEHAEVEYADIALSTSKTQNSPSHSNTPVVYSNASAKVTIGGHDQTKQGEDQARSSEHAEVEYADIALSPSKTQTSPSHSNTPVVYSNASAKVTIGGHDQTRQGRDHARSSEHVEVEYADIALSPSNTETNVARQTQQPAEYQSLGPNRNRAPSDELPPLPPPSNRNNGGPTGAHDTPRYYQSLKKKT